ncbi:hypothetical protein [Nitrobacter sp. TKz-YC02]|uniref:hypothetical protein n=1 Tax=Nitrobacter sp. TKz-YC02 TaxID=3398704 RepID=UPI003CE74C93
MSKVIFLDTDAILNALRAGEQVGDRTAILDVWQSYAQKIGAQIEITDVVAEEAGLDGALTLQLIDDRTVRLAPGMAVTAEIKTGQRRVIEYLLLPLLRYRYDAARER